jgi:flagellar basal body-associated protein FliL
LTERGFDHLQDPFGVMLVTFGFIIVALIVVAGGVVAWMIEKENAKKRREMKDAKDRQDKK